MAEAIIGRALNPLTFLATAAGFVDRRQPRQGASMLNRPAFILIGLAAVMWSLGTYAQPNNAPAPPPSFAAEGPPVTILSERDMQSNGLFYPDMPLGVVRASAGNYFFFASGAGIGPFGPGRSVVPQGTYKFGGTLDHFGPAKTSGRWPQPSMTAGDKQPSPDGSDFDRDYGGGGPTYLVRDPRTKQPLLLLLYHGEFHAAAQPGMPFYGSSGLAVSTDNGDSFIKIGEILSPHLARAEFFENTKTGGVTADGSLVEADASGDPIGPGTAPDDKYYYAVFTDRGDFKARQNIAIARVKEADMMNGITQRRVPQFMKFFSPTGTGGSAAAHFTEPGIGGQSTYIVSDAAYLATPDVYYDTTIRKFVLVYQRNQKEIVLRTASNLLQWSDPVTVSSAPADSDFRVFYPALVGTEADPRILGKEFYLYYLQREMPGNRNMSLQRVTVQ
jgi:hypothetical protein